MTEQWNKDYPMGMTGLLYQLFHVDNPRRVPILPPETIEACKAQDDRDDLKHECVSLNWALQHKDYDYKSILDLPYGNDDIVCYFQNLADVYDREGLFDLVGLECVEKQTKTAAEEQYFQDNYVDPSGRLDYIDCLFFGIGERAFPNDKKLPLKYLQRHMTRWGVEGYPIFREQLEWCKEHPNFDYAEYLSLNLSNSELLNRFDEIDEYLTHLESEVQA